MVLHMNLCVVFLKVLEAVFNLIPHLSLNSFGVTSDFQSELENLFEAGISDLPESNSLSRTKIFGTLTSGSNIVTFMDAIFQLIQFNLNKHSAYSSSY